MNTHLERAREYIGKGEEFYRKAAEEITVAMSEDSTLSYRQVAEQVGRDREWCRRLVTWSTNGESLATPWAGEQDRKNTTATKKVLRESTPEQVEEIVADLTPERARVIADALTFSHPATMASSAFAHERATTEAIDAAQKERVPGLVKAHGFYSVLADLFSAKRSYGRALDAVRELDLSDEEKDALAEATDRIGLVHDWFGSFLSSGSRDFDNELAALLSEES